MFVDILRMASLELKRMGGYLQALDRRAPLERPCASEEGGSMLLRREGGFLRRGEGFLRRGGGS